MEKELLREAYHRILEGIKITAASTKGKFPHYADGQTGEWTCSPSGDWTGGYWNGMLWLAAASTKDSQYLNWAREWTALLEQRIESKTVFRGFLFYYGAILGSILAGDQMAKDIAIRAAKSVASQYNSNAGLIPLGDEAEEASSVGPTETNIDGVISSPLLFWASKEIGETSLVDIGINHALKHIELCIREDGSVCQSATFDPSGNLIRRYTHKGYSDNSTWGRAQAWAMMHFTLSYMWAPHEQKLLDAAIQVSDWWVRHLPDNGVAFWDFDDPGKPHTNRDTSATAIGASALLKLSCLVQDEKRGKVYQETAVKSITRLVSDYLTPTSEQDRRRPGMLLGGCFNKKLGVATESELIWGDYYLFESLGGLLGYFKPNMF
ncbi:glycoside hydrolase family 88 protein [Effusibacillus lacus]|uniref:Glucuronyl hydrolase n=1 Tax=Effusibacillus lacus TaxID=1348429 RepID=A0A292YIL2_9BACL|nr:glycoside hydrolase family 88 protein [Effusibacillus lacus]TCS74762.1 unsaturated chondroitin disaccharide hydrolase [Effusibacillus lacus]GAX88573.1 glucuronyl hydrolase [Effusibacillus lacus]